MPKYFLYIDESKDYKNHTLFLGGLVSKIGFGHMEQFCQGCTSQLSKKELKSTQQYDRNFFEKILSTWNIPFTTFVQKICAHSDIEYLIHLTQLVESFLQEYNDVVEMDIFADFTRLGSETKKIEQSFSRKLSHRFDKNIQFCFRNSAKSRTIQFADLAVWIYRRQKKAPAFDVSTSKSKTSLRIHSSGAS